MSDLEQELRKRALAGELTYLSICPVAGKGNNAGNVVFVATYSPASQWGHGFGRAADPVEAILAALNDSRFKTLKSKLAKVGEAAREPIPEQVVPPAVPAAVDDFGQPV